MTSADHPAAAGKAVRVAELAGLRLRLPPRAADPSLYDAVHKRCAEADLVVRQGRDVTSIEDTLLEIATGAAAWTVVPDSLVDITSCEPLDGVAIRPLEPPLSLPVCLLLPAGGETPYAQALSDAFRP